MNVKMSKKYADEIFDLSSELAEIYTRELHPYELKGHRLHKSLNALTMASALREKRPEVNDMDVKRIRYLSQWMNLDFKLFEIKNSYVDGILKL